MKKKLSLRNLNCIFQKEQFLTSEIVDNSEKSERDW
ncbi:hypothetical protein CLOLEP_00343 [[Clostridium] leptum DSM 753]|uniref:Uncharacterized protein n=1 Tax=[Clostridium] leptum DSM 753 TaxID=428125 RepID=A7VP67_9FIRM|nr:hypothetical protein CLOLEP_00343 [[Clostridium] leptum DSM 753]